MVSGVITKGIGGFYYVDIGEKTYECKARGLFRLKNIKPIVGDIVEIEVDEKTGDGYIIDIKERKSKMIRPEVANVEHVVIVVSMKKPDLNMYLLQKFLVYAEFIGLKITVCINKIDIVNQEDYEPVLKMLNSIPYKVIKTSVISKIGIEELASSLYNKISVFAGPSGVGKSSLLNAMNPKLELKTGKLSDKTKRGTHTTRHTELIKLDSGGMVVDTPGFTSFDMFDIKEVELQNYYPEFEIYKNCRFFSCIHDKEPDCGVKEAVLSGYIYKERYESYIEMLKEIKEVRRF